MEFSIQLDEYAIKKRISTYLETEISNGFFAIADKQIQESIKQMCQKHVDQFLDSDDVKQMIFSKLIAMCEKDKLSKMIDKRTKAAFDSYLSTSARDKVISYLKDACEQKHVNKEIIEVLES